MDGYVLAIGDRAYSSWSLRGWLLFDAFGLPVQVRQARLYTDELPALLADFFPARTVPAIRTPEGAVVPDSIAIAEELASRHPRAGHWPEEPAMRATARALVAEMHAGFVALRSDCPMNIRAAWRGFEPAAAVMQDLARLSTLWQWARERSGATGPWLFGAYSAADAFFAPVAGRIATYGLPVGPEAAAYVAAHLHHPSFRRWRAMALVDGPDQPFYHRDWETRPWPGPAPRPARPAEPVGLANPACPHTGRPITHALEMDGRRYGFCSAFCRDRTLADPEAWPQFMALTG